MKTAELTIKALTRLGFIPCEQNLNRNRIEDKLMVYGSVLGVIYFASQAILNVQDTIRWNDLISDGTGIFFFVTLGAMFYSGLQRGNFYHLILVFSLVYLVAMSDESNHGKEYILHLLGIAYLFALSKKKGESPVEDFAEN